MRVVILCRFDEDSGDPDGHNGRFGLDGVEGRCGEVVVNVEAGVEGVRGEAFGGLELHICGEPPRDTD